MLVAADRALTERLLRAYRSLNDGNHLRDKANVSIMSTLDRPPSIVFIHHHLFEGRRIPSSANGLTVWVSEFPL